jgi:hypothetical protein
MMLHPMGEPLIPRLALVLAALRTDAGIARVFSISAVVPTMRHTFLTCDSRLHWLMNA